MPKVTWLGDADPLAQVIEQYGHTFVKGEPVEVGDKDPHLAKFRYMGAVFSVGGKVEPIESKEPAPVDTDTGTEIAAVRAALDAKGIKYDGRSGLDTLRAKLAAAEAE